MRASALRSISSGSPAPSLPTTRDGVRADHILVSDQAPIELVPDSYRVHPNDVSDHWAVECQLRFGIPESISDLISVAASAGAARL